MGYCQPPKKRKPSQTVSAIDAAQIKCDHDGGSAAYRSFGRAGRGRPALGHDLWRYQLHHRQDAKEHNHQIVEVPYDGDEIRDQDWS